jgi:hypothetical protein
MPGQAVAAPRLLCAPQAELAVFAGRTAVGKPERAASRGRAAGTKVITLAKNLSGSERNDTRSRNEADYLSKTAITPP